jgi:hypothetical protein
MGNTLSCNYNNTNIEYENDHTCFAKNISDVDDIKVKSMNTTKGNHSKNDSQNLFENIQVLDKQFITREELDSKISKKIKEIIDSYKDNVELTESDISHYLNPVRLNEEFYEGQWNIQGERHGVGLCVESQGSVYYGEWHHDIKEGKGIYINTNCDSYGGEWNNGIMNGIGQLIVKDQFQYIGEFRDGVREGKGVEITDEYIYYGELRNNVKDGFGVIKVGDSTYKGYFENNMYNGIGHMNWSDGRKYEGNWKNNKMDGLGVNIWSNGHKYVGHYHKGKKKGQGVYYWSKSKYYNGQWAYNKPHGSGKYKGENNFSCDWRYGKPMFTHSENK